jgi:hypothetical protein
MTILRVGSCPRQSIRLQQNLRVFLDSSFEFPDGDAGYRIMSGSELVDLIEPLLETPTLRSILSVYIRCIPLNDESDWKQALQDGITKELSVTQLDLRPSLRYPFLTSREACLRETMHDAIPYNPLIQLDLRQKFIRWKIDVSSQVLVPNPSNKSMGYHSSADFWRTVYPDRQVMELRPVSSCDLEEFYAETGLVTKGPCEVRYAWKYNDVKPRIYYAMGADAYFAGRYVDYLFDSMQRLYRNTNPAEVCDCH